MGYIGFDHNGYFTCGDNQPFYIAGINYIPRYTCTNFWRDWRPDAIEHDLDIVRDMGLNAVRFPVHWDTFEPQEGVFDESMFDRFGVFLDMCRARAIYAMPWFLVGVATYTYDVSWRAGRSYFEESMIVAEERHIREFAKRWRDDPIILMWDLCDEPEFFYNSLDESAGIPDAVPYPMRPFTEWVRRLYTAVKAVDNNHLVTLSFGHIATGRYGMDLRSISRILDVMGVTAYPEMGTMPIDGVRPGYEIMFHVDMNRVSTPVFLSECPGHSEMYHAKQALARYFDTVFWAAWMHGSAGVMPWALNNFDESIWDFCVFRRDPAETSFGVVDSQDRLKPTGERLAAFAAAARDIDAVQYRRMPSRTALLIPRKYHEHADDAYPRKLAPVHAALCATGLAPDMLWWDEDASKYNMLIVAASDGLGTDNARALAEYVKKGGTLLYIADFGKHTPYFERMFGLCPHGQIRRTKALNAVFSAAFGAFAPGDAVHIESQTGIRAERMDLCGAYALATFDNGWPALTLHRYGKGTSIYIAADIMAGYQQYDDAQWRDSPVFAIMEAAAQTAGIARHAWCDDRAIEVGMLSHVSKRRWALVAVNRSEEDVHAAVHIHFTDVTVADTHGEAVSAATDAEGTSWHTVMKAGRGTVFIINQQQEE